MVSHSPQLRASWSPKHFMRALFSEQGGTEDNPFDSLTTVKHVLPLLSMCVRNAILSNENSCRSEWNRAGVRSLVRTLGPNNGLLRASYELTYCTHPGLFYTSAWLDNAARVSNYSEHMPPVGQSHNVCVPKVHSYYPSLQNCLETRYCQALSSFQTF